MIEIRNLSKTFGKQVAVDDASFEVRPGAVTGLLGPNGAGKSTTLRILLGIDQPDAGSATIDGVPYRHLRAPLRVVGGLLDAGWVHPRRSVRNHVRWVAESNGIPRDRIATVLEQVGLESVARRRCGQLSLGMRQRLGLAVALLGEPDHLVLDEPSNGLDPEGVRWMRDFMRSFVATGRTVLLSSHMLGEVSQTVDDLVVIARGATRYSGSVGDFTSRATRRRVRVRVADPEPFAATLRERGFVCSAPTPGARGLELVVEDADGETIGTLAASVGAVTFEIGEEQTSLEDAFLAEIDDGTEYRGKP